MDETEKTEENKKSFPFLFFLAILLSLLLFYLGQNNKKISSDKFEKILSDKEAILILDYGQKKQRWFKGEVIDGMTVFDAITTASLAGNFNFQANSHLNLLDNLSNNGKSRWICYLNEREIAEPLNKITIHPKDKILCQYK